MSAENTTTNIEHSAGTGAIAPEVGIQRQVIFPQQEKEEETKMADVDTVMLSQEHSDIRREQAEQTSTIRREAAEHTNEIVREGLKGDYSTLGAIKDSRFETVSRVENNADRIERAVSSTHSDTLDRFFAVGRDLADVRAQLVQAIANTDKAAELNSLKGIIEGQKNTQYLAEKIAMEGDKTRGLIQDLKYHDLNRALVERNAELVEERWGHRYWRGAWDQNQFAAVSNQVQALNSQFQNSRQGMVNFGTQAGVGQTSTTNQA